MKRVMAIVVLMMVALMAVTASGVKEPVYKEHYVGTITSIKSVSAGSFTAPSAVVIVLDNGHEYVITGSDNVKAAQTGAKVYWMEAPSNYQRYLSYWEIRSNNPSE